MTRLFLWQ